MFVFYLSEKLALQGYRADDSLQNLVSNSDTVVFRYISQFWHCADQLTVLPCLSKKQQNANQFV